MANRILRDTTNSVKVDRLSVEAERFFYRLMMKVDDYGAHPATAKLLNGLLFPLKDYTDKKISAWIDECIEADLIMTYTVEGRKYLKIKDFGQKLRRMKHTYPPPVDGQVTDNERTSDGQRADKKRPETETETETETKQKALVGANAGFENLEKQLLSALDELFLDGIRLKAKMTYPGVNIDQQLERFRLKVNHSPRVYADHGVGGLRLAFLHQLSNAKAETTKAPVNVKKFLADA